MRMALDMQHRLAELNIQWRNNGMQHPFGVRMGINTGFCNVGNFGSADRMDYTIIGAEANLAARLQSNAEPGQIVLSYETYVLVRDIVVAQAQPPIMMKGISREIVPYAVRGTLDAAGEKIEIFREHMAGLDLYLNPSMVNTNHAEHIRTVLQEALKALERNGARAAAASVEAPR
jgi:citrate lyase gamma subunit